MQDRYRRAPADRPGSGHGGRVRRPVRYIAAGIGTGILLGAMPTGAYGLAAVQTPPPPVETLTLSPLWQAARASYDAVAPSGSASLVTTVQIRAWARSASATPDLLTALDVPLEMRGQFDGVYPAADATFLADMASADPGPVARAVLVGLLGLGLGPAPQNLDAVAPVLFPGPHGLERLVENANLVGPYQTALPGLLQAYGLAGQAGIAYVRRHPGAAVLIEALAGTVQTATQAKALWSALPTSADQMAFLTAFPYMPPPGVLTLERTARPYPEEVLLEEQYQPGTPNPSARSLRPVLAHLNRLANRYGVPHTAVGVPEPVMAAAVAEDPGGYLARSTKAYAKVRHAAYFGLERCDGSYTCWPYSYGRVQYDPTRGVKNWPGFLAAYGRAPGADDGAYRLGRDEELLGHDAQAVETFNKGLSLPDGGGIAYDLAAREVWVLDTQMTPQALSSFYQSLGKGQEPLRLRVLYSLGVDELRDGAYTDATRTLTTVADAIGSRSLALLPYPNAGPWPFAAAVRIQALQAADLAGLQRKLKAAKTPALRASLDYDMAAFMYHRTLLFYNNLWGGSAQTYSFLGYQPPVVTASFIRYEESENNFVQAADRFRALQASWVSPVIRARALFSYGMALYDLSGYGPYAQVLYTPSVLASDTARAFGTFAQTYPGSPLAPEALTLQAAFTRDRGLLKTLVSRYGGTPQGADAKKDLSQNPWPSEPDATVGSTVATSEIYQNTPGVPKDVLTWAAGPGPVVATRTVGPVTYIRVRPNVIPSGQWPVLNWVTDAGPGRIRVSWGTGDLAVGVAHPVVLFPTFSLSVLPGRDKVVATTHVHSGLSAQ